MSSKKDSRDSRISSPSNTAAIVANQKPFSQIFLKGAKSAMGGGIPGACAMGLQVLGLMWLRTTMNYQYRHGSTTIKSMKTLYAQGGIPRFYKGLLPALIQGPMSRFGDTAANDGVLAALESAEITMNLPIAFKTMGASFCAAGFRLLLLPVDCVKTIMQVEGNRGLPILKQKIRTNGLRVLFYGGFASFSATFAGHYPWFFTYNFLQEKLPQKKSLWARLARTAFIGFCSSAVSDTVSNSIRVIKTTKQTAAVRLSYFETVKEVVNKDGIIGLFGRGLKTRLLTNCIQGLVFAVLWKGIQQMLFAGTMREKERLK